MKDSDIFFSVRHRRCVANLAC